jgi:molybdopterin/thiamine biosynthesis adenylyltransferase/rhodanese-related sulfurtransferase
MTGKQYSERYHRQILLPGFGKEGQKKLSEIKVLVIGAGGLGCPALQYLAAAGAGTIGIVDGDTVSLNNLHRQVLYTTQDIGFPKAETAAKKLQQLNDEIDIIPYQLKLSNHNAISIIKKYDIVLDGTDNFPSRYMINDACALLNKPLVYGAISQFEGQVSVFNVEDNSDKKVNYRDLFPNPPKEDEVLNCAEAGVLGVLPGIIGSMQANEVIKLVTGIGQPLINRLLVYNALTNLVYEMALQPSKSINTSPKNENAFLEMDYNWFCGIPEDHPAEIDPDIFNQLIIDQAVTVIDVREYGELPDIDEFNYLNIPLSQIKNKIPYIEGDKIITFCQTGQRSLQALKLMVAEFGNKKEIYSLRGGIEGWIKKQEFDHER